MRHYIQHGRASVLVDGQYGSTGKGLLAAYLASQPQNRVDFAVTNASANAGHWTKFADPDKRDFVCFHIPTFGVVQESAEIYLNAGAIIDPDILFQEIETLGISRRRIKIHPNAAVIEGLDKDLENFKGSYAEAISSTRKGVGSALARKVTRSAGLAKADPRLQEFIGVVPLNSLLNRGARVSVEVPQGFSLSVDGPFYPYCTSRNCTVMQGLSDALIHPSFLGSVAMSMRTHPIRVGNLPGQSSGDCYDDQEEITFESIGVAPEYTTVTKRMRRIFTWSSQQAYEAVAANRPDLVFLNFCNYVKDPQTLDRIIQSINHAMCSAGHYANILTGYGPNVEDVRFEAKFNARFNAKFNAVGRKH